MRGIRLGLLWLALVGVAGPLHAQTVLLAPSQDAKLSAIQAALELIDAMVFDTDDGNIADGQVPQLSASLLYIHNGANWARWGGTVAVSQLATAAALSDNFANPTTTQMYALAGIWDGATWDRWTGAVTVTSGSISCSNCSGSGASDVDDSSFTIGTDSVAPAGFLFDDVTPDSVDEGDVGLARMAANRVAYQIIRDAAGNERGANVDASNQLAVLDGNSAAALTALQLIDNLVLVEDVAASDGTSGLAAFGIRRDTTPSSSAGTAGNLAMFNLDANGRLYVNATLYDAAGAALTQDTQLTHDGALTVGTTTGGALFGRASAAAPSDVSADNDAVLPWHLRNGAAATVLTAAGALIGGDATNGLDVDVTRVQGSVTVAQGTASNLNMTEASAAAIAASVALLDDAVVSHDGSDAAATLGVGVRAIAHGTNPTAVAAADRTVWYANRAGIPFVIGGHPNVISAEAQVQDADGAQTDAALVTVSAGTKVVVTRAYAVCDDATTAGTQVVLGFGATTLPTRAHTGVAGIIIAGDGHAPGGGIHSGDGSGILAVGADGEDLRLTTEDPVGGACSVGYSYYTIES